jgi:hypothetical protein
MAEQTQGYDVEVPDEETVRRDQAILEVGLKGIEDKPIRISVFTAGFLLGLIRNGRFTTTQGKYQAAVAQGELEAAIQPFLPKEVAEPSRAEKRRQKKR